jgi:nucleoid-associated protein YgaU
LAGLAPAASANGARTIAAAPSVRFNTPVRGQIYDGAFISGYSVAYWTAPLAEGDTVKISTNASGGATPPCQILFMPGTDDLNIDGQPPVLDPASMTRHGPRDFQRFVPVTQAGSYVLAMTNDDIFLSGPHQCLAAPAGQPFTFTVMVDHRGGGDGSGRSGGGGGERARERSDRASTHVVVAPGQSLWAIAERLLGARAGIARVALRVDRLWQLNAARIGTGNPDLIYPGQTLLLK